MTESRKVIKKIDGFLKPNVLKRKARDLEEEGDSSDDGEYIEPDQKPVSYTVGEVTYLGNRGIGMRWFINETLTTLTFARYVTMNNGKTIKEPNTPSVCIFNCFVI